MPHSDVMPAGHCVTCSQLSQSAIVESLTNRSAIIACWDPVQQLSSSSAVAARRCNTSCDSSAVLARAMQLREWPYSRSDADYVDWNCAQL